MPYPETVEYVKKQLAEGFSSDQIREALEGAGYEPDVIDSLMSEAATPDAPKKASHLEKILLKDVALAFFVVIVGGGIIYTGFLMPTSPQFFSPESPASISLSFGPAATIDSGTVAIIDLSLFVSDPYYPPEDIRWFFRGQQCISFTVDDTGSATITSNYRAGCPSTERILVEAINPEGESASDVLKVRVR